LAALGVTHEGLQARLSEADAQLKSVLRVFVGEADIRTLDGLETPVADGEVLSIVLPVAGA
jgi:molybdopterin converting factor small subunit